MTNTTATIHNELMNERHENDIHAEVYDLQNCERCRREYAAESLLAAALEGAD